MHPFLQNDGPIPMVHRGAPLGRDGTVVENTEAAFRRAYSLGFRYFETDVRATRDGVLVASHDSTLRRVAGDRARVADLTWSELSQIAVGGGPLTRLAHLLDAYPDVSFNIDPKADAALRPLVDLLLEREALDRTCIASFSDRRLRWVRAALGRRVCTSAGPRELATASSRVARGGPLALHAVDVLQIPYWLSRRWVTRRQTPIDLVEAAARVGLPVYVWTVNDGPDMADLLERGVDGVMSDDTDLLAEVFGAHGWQPRR